MRNYQVLADDLEERAQEARDRLDFAEGRSVFEKAQRLIKEVEAASRQLEINHQRFLKLISEAESDPSLISSKRLDEIVCEKQNVATENSRLIYSVRKKDIELETLRETVDHLTAELVELQQKYDTEVWSQSLEQLRLKQKNATLLQDIKSAKKENAQLRKRMTHTKQVERLGVKKTARQAKSNRTLTLKSKEILRTANDAPNEEKNTYGERDGALKAKMKLSLLKDIDRLFEE